MIETSLKAKIPTEIDSGFFYCPYIPEGISKNSDMKFEAKVGYKERQKSLYEPRKPVLPETSNVRSPKSSPYDASGRPKTE